MHVKHGLIDFVLPPFVGLVFAALFASRVRAGEKARTAVLIGALCTGIGYLVLFHNTLMLALHLPLAWWSFIHWGVTLTLLAALIWRMYVRNCRS